MKIYREITIDIETGAVLHEDSYEYSGPIDKCDRAAQAAAKGQINTDTGIAGQAGQSAGAERGILFPTLKNDINNPTGFTPNQINQNLTAAEAGAGGALGSFAGKAGLNANVTRNSAALPGTLDALARAKAQAASTATGNITAESNRLAQAKRASALKETAGLYGTDVSAQLKAMGLATDATNAEVNAGKSGWLQNTEGVIDTLSGAAKAAFPKGVQG